MVTTTYGNKNETIELLRTHQATLYVVYARLQSFHWNIKGPHFFEYHEVLGNMYETIGQYVDQIAERILMCMGSPLTTLREYLMYSAVGEINQKSFDVYDVASLVLDDLEVLISQLRQGIASASEQGDDGTVDLLSGMLRAHEKQRYMWTSVVQ